MMVSVIIVSYNSEKDLPGAIDSLQRHCGDPSVEIVVVDNGSTDSSCELIERAYPAIRLVRRATNGGFGAGCNEGARHAVGDYLLFMNSDVTLTGNPLPPMIDRMSTEAGTCIVGCQLRNTDGSAQPSWFRWPGLSMRFLHLTGIKDLLLNLAPSLRHSPNRRDDSGFASGAFFLIRKNAFETLGRFDEQFFMYLEDADLCYRAVSRAGKIVIVDTGNVIHHGRHYETLDNPFVFYHSNRGLILFFRKHFPRWKWYLLWTMTMVFVSARLGGLVLVGAPGARRKPLVDVLKLYATNLRSSDLP